MKILAGVVFSHLNISRLLLIKYILFLTNINYRRHYTNFRNPSLHLIQFFVWKIIKYLIKRDSLKLANFKGLFELPLRRDHGHACHNSIITSGDLKQQASIEIRIVLLVFSLDSSHCLPSCFWPFDWYYKNFPFTSIVGDQNHAEVWVADYWKSYSHFLNIRYPVQRSPTQIST